MEESNTKKSFLKSAQEFLEEKVVPVAAAVGNQTHLAAIRDGLTVLVPVTIIGGFACLLAMPPVAATLEPTNFFFQLLCMWRDWSAVHMNTLLIPYNLTIGIISIYVVLGIAYQMASTYQMNSISNMICCLLTYLCVAGVPQAFAVEEASVSAIPTANLGASGMFTAILIALAVSEINHQCIKHNLVIKMPASVPPNVAAPFNVLIPTVINVLLFMGLDAALKAGAGYGLCDLIYKLIQPLLSATGSLPSIILINVLMTTFWFFGIHGGNMMGVVTTPITTMGLTLNAEAYAAGKELPVFFAGAVNTVYGGWISYFALVLAIILFCKSDQLRSITKIAAVPSFFNINEPLIFGLPTVLNPYTLVFFLIANNINLSIAYFLTQAGFIGKFFITLPFTVPAPLQAWLASMDWKGMIVWAGLLVLDVLIATPLIRAYDKQLLKTQMEEETEEEAQELVLQAQAN